MEINESYEPNYFWVQGPQCLARSSLYGAFLLCIAKCFTKEMQMCYMGKLSQREKLLASDHIAEMGTEPSSPNSVPNPQSHTAFLGNELLTTSSSEASISTRLQKGTPDSHSCFFFCFTLKGPLIYFLYHQTATSSVFFNLLPLGTWDINMSPGTSSRGNKTSR